MSNESQGKSSYVYNLRWRKKHPEIWAEDKRRYYAKTQNAPNSKMRYTEEEINMIMEHSISDMELAKKLKRSVKAIQVFRSKRKNKYSSQ